MGLSKIIKVKQARHSMTGFMFYNKVVVDELQGKQFDFLFYVLTERVGR